MDKIVKPARLAMMIVLFVSLVAVYFITLYKLQIIDGAAYYESSQNSIATEKTITAARGNIMDRYGRLLVSNRSCNNIVIDDNWIQNAPDHKTRNSVILQLIETVLECGDTYIDTLPITMEPPFEYVQNMTDVQRTRLSAYFKDQGLAEDTSAVELMAYFRTRYGIDNNYDAVQMRRIAGVRYEVNVRYIINTSDYIFAEDVSIELISKLMEGNLPGFDVETSYIREYKTIYASHLLGYVGLINEQEYQTYMDKGYRLDAKVGKDGVEKEFEEYLHGQDGRAIVTSTSTGTVTNTVYRTEPEPGNHIYLTIDIGLQEASEQALASGIAKLNEAREKENAEYIAYGMTDKVQELSTAGALVAIDIATGEPLAMASYPGYDLSTLMEDYSDLLEDDTKPLFNRALQGTYAPGSTFKMVTALAALEEEIVSINYTVHDEGKFTKYEDTGYAPTCWIYGKGSHGDVNVTSAIEHSCNYYFYVVGDLLKIGPMEDYANRFGLGVSTGIELPEATGYAASPEKMAEVAGRDWYLGDTLQAAMGQSIHQFTPLQIATYVATLANSGTRYSTSILKTVRSYDYSEKLYSREPEVLSEVGGIEEYYDAIRLGMKAGAQTGTAMDIFKDYPVQVATKTGTAQMGEDAVNNAVFVCYAPYDDPQIAIAVVIEKGQAGSAIGTIARYVLDYYFSFESSTTALETELSLLR